jgi:hypothetical protein
MLGPMNFIWVVGPVFAACAVWVLAVWVKCRVEEKYHVRRLTQLTALRRQGRFENMSCFEAWYILDHWFKA